MPNSIGADDASPDMSATNAPGFQLGTFNDAVAEQYLCALIRYSSGPPLLGNTSEPLTISSRNES
jgi:hypothetical protein